MPLTKDKLMDAETTSSKRANLRLRKALPRDAPSIHRLHIRSVRTLCRGHYSQEQIDAWLKDRGPESYHDGINRDEMYIAESKGVIAGFGHALSGEIRAIFVDPDFTNRGIGKDLLRRGIEMARQEHSGPVKLEATLNAVSFYQKSGFIKIKPVAVNKNGVDLPLILMQEAVGDS